MIRHIVTYILKLVEDYPLVFKALIFLIIAIWVLLAAVDELWLDRT